MLTFGGINNAEVYTHRALGVVWTEAEGVVAQVFARLNVVLIAICPVERDLLALIGNGVHPRLIDALGKEIPLRIVPAEEAVQVVIDLALQTAHIHSFI